MKNVIKSSQWQNRSRSQGVLIFWFYIWNVSVQVDQNMTNWFIRQHSWKFAILNLTWQGMNSKYKKCLLLILDDILLIQKKYGQSHWYEYKQRPLYRHRAERFKVRRLDPLRRWQNNKIHRFWIAKWIYSLLYRWIKLWIKLATSKNLYNALN